MPQAYLSLAEDYQRRATLFPGWRERLVEQLAPRPGDVVIDVGCGPGLNFTALQTHLGPTGRIIGIDESPQLLAVAAHQATRHGWDNIELINTPVHGIGDEAVEVFASAPSRVISALPAPRGGVRATR
ncbi:MAG TPA: methyltransferase domain-containing protein [Pseudonocardia sp.]|uniref:methyltransferase domain-containing protein n=1 Tax=Pseudonocardia sp. TaxID=60912 RepID=UPI002C482092|nr:methyltransferase domain-containing protein [Pseudonocardia sp.]HTF54435.1 methyltransferase domain-containing protein [Pseudonocardia sp.]